MVENIGNNIDDKYEIDKSKTPDKDFDEEKNIEQGQAITHERNKAKREQEEEAGRLFQQNFPDEASTISGNFESQPIKNESQ
jgi:hypothetical protein